MLSYSEIKPKTYIVCDGKPYEVLSSHVFRKQQRKPVNQTKLKNLETGKVIERSFHQSEKVEEAQIEKKEIKFLYSHRDSWWFSEKDNPSARFSVEESVIGERGKFLKENSKAEALLFNDKIIGITPPIKVVLEVKTAPPGIKGNTAQGGTKRVTLETGAVVNAPLFVNEGDKIEINTEKGEYVQRVN